MRAQMVSAALLCVLSNQADAQPASDLGRQQMALDMLVDTAAQLCESPSLWVEGDDQRLKLSGAANVKLNKLIKNFVDLGIEGAAEYETGNWKGILQGDLAPLIERSMQCRTDVLRILADRMLPTTPPPLPPGKTFTLPNALANHRYEFGWSNAPRGTVDKRFKVAPITNVHMLSADFAELRYWRPEGEGTLRVTLRGRQLSGQWRDHEGVGEINLVFDESLARGAGWWNRGGLTQQYNAFMRRTE